MKQFLFTCIVLVLGLAAPVNATPVQWTAAQGGNGHWYEVISSKQEIKWTTAKSLAEASVYDGQSGYLATITSAAEQKSLNRLNKAHASAWLGGTDAASEGTWEWLTGESFGYSNWTKWANNKGRVKKDFLAGWINKNKWKDCRNNTVKCTIYTYVVEYDAAPVSVSPVPLPAALPLLLIALGGLGFAARRRKST